MVQSIVRYLEPFRYLYGGEAAARPKASPVVRLC